MKELHILNLGTGVQSTTLYLMFLRGDLLCVPLAEAVIEEPESSREQIFTGFYQECNGLCGN